MKRLIISTLWGFIAGFVCYSFAASGGGELSLYLILNIIFARALIGFGIGISKLKMGHWAIHGLVMGLIFSIPFAFGAMLGDNPDFTPWSMFMASVVMGGIYGLLIELITTLVFKAKQ
jgi:hypothetical protein